MLLERAGMRCPERPRKWFLFRWLDYHDFELVPGSLKPWGDSKWCSWELTWRCKSCGTKGHEFGLEQREVQHLIDKHLGGDESCDT
jgi:hypothetical protein